MYGGGRYLPFKVLPLYFHSSFICPGTRMREGIRSFLDECKAAGRSEKSAHYLYVNGFDPMKSRIPVADHLRRGASLSRLTDMWLNTWGEDSDWSLSSVVKRYMYSYMSRMCSAMLCYSCYIFMSPFAEYQWMIQFWGQATYLPFFQTPGSCWHKVTRWLSGISCTLFINVSS